MLRIVSRGGAALVVAGLLLLTQLLPTVADDGAENEVVDSRYEVSATELTLVVEFAGAVHSVGYSGLRVAVDTTGDMASAGGLDAAEYLVIADATGSLQLVNAATFETVDWLRYWLGGRELGIHIRLEVIGYPSTACLQVVSPAAAQPATGCTIVDLPPPPAFSAGGDGWMRYADPAGDHGPSSDIVSLATQVTGSDLLIAIDLAADWTPQAIEQLFVWIDTSPDATFSGSCSGWDSDYFIKGIVVSDGPAILLPGARGAFLRLAHRADGKRLTITLPLAQLGDPDAVRIHVRQPDEVPDDESTCLAVTLGPVVQTEPAGGSDALTLSLAIALVALVGATAIFGVWWFTRRPTGAAHA